MPVTNLIHMIRKQNLPGCLFYIMKSKLTSAILQSVLKYVILLESQSAVGRKTADQIFVVIWMYNFGSSQVCVF